MENKKIVLFIIIFIFSLIFAPNVYSKDDCNIKFTVQSEGTLMGGMGNVNTTMYHKNCYEWVEKQDTNVAGINQNQTVVHKNGYVYTNNNGNWTKTKDPTYENIKKMRKEGKTNKDILTYLGGRPMNKQSNEYLEPCSFWNIFGTETCYTADWIPVFVGNQMMTIKATKITRDNYGPDKIYNVPDNVPESQLMQGGEVPDLGQIMKDAMKKQN